MLQTKNYLRRYEAVFNYNEKQIPFYFWSNTKQQDTKPDVILFLGAAQIGRIPSWVAAAAPHGVVVVEGLPHWHSSPEHDIVDFAEKYAATAFATIFSTFNLRSVHLMAESQAAPAVIILANNQCQKVKNVALLFPLGLNTRHFGDTDAARFREFKRRSLQSMLQPEQSPLRDLRNFYAGMTLARIVVAGLWSGSLVRHYSAGVAFDILKEFRSLVQCGQKAASQGAHRVILFLGERDKLFPLQEVTTTLEEAAITDVQIEVIENKSHGSLATKASAPLVRRAVEAVRLPR